MIRVKIHESHETALTINRLRVRLVLVRGSFFVDQLLNIF